MSSDAAITPPLYALVPAVTSPLLVAFAAISNTLTSLLHSSASAVQSVIPAPRPPATVQETVARWHAAQRYKTVAQYGTALTLLAVGVVLLLCAVVVPLPVAVVLFGVEALTLSMGWLRLPVFVLGVVLLALGAVALYRFYAPLPSLNNVSQKQRKLLGLPYSEESFLQSTSTTAPSIPADSMQPADGIRRRNNAAVSMFASAPLINRSALYPTSDSPFPTLSATSLFTPVKATPLDNSGAMTDEKQLHQFFAEQASKQAQLQSTPASAYAASSFYSPYRTGGGLSSHTPPYVTSVRTLPTMVRSGPSGSGRFALEDPRSDAESAERANEVTWHLAAAGTVLLSWQWWLVLTRLPVSLRCCGWASVVRRVETDERDRSVVCSPTHTHNACTQHMPAYQQNAVQHTVCRSADSLDRLFLSLGLPHAMTGRETCETSAIQHRT